MLKISTQKGFAKWVNGPWTDMKGRLPPAAIQDVDIRRFGTSLAKRDFCSSLFLGCEMTKRAHVHIVSSGGIVIPDNKRFSFEAHRAGLYTPNELFKGFTLDQAGGYQASFDYKVYEEYLEHGRRLPPIDVSLHRQLHDHSITEALNEATKDRKVVAIMGGHGMERGDPFYAQIAALSRRLTNAGYLMVSGGGPGAMEATHLGAYFATLGNNDMEAAINQIKVRPNGAPKGKEYADADWLSRAWRVREAFPLTSEQRKKSKSIGIPTWFYGHEPPAPFPTHIAKYFANSIREDGLLMMATHGVIFAPGSAGTTQEIFQDAAQNHYGTAGFISPMIMFGKDHWTNKRPVWPLLETVSKGKKYGELVALTDNPDEVFDLIEAYDPGEYQT